MGTTVISCGNSSPILESAKHYLYFMPLLIQSFVIRNRFFSIPLAWDASSDAFVTQSFTEPVGIISPVCEKLISLGQVFEQNCRTFVIACLSLCQVQRHWLTGRVAKGMKF